jgi:hypothetical protein
MATSIPPDALCRYCDKPGCNASQPLYGGHSVLARLRARRRGETLELVPCGEAHYHVGCKEKFDAMLLADRAPEPPPIA